MLRPIIQIITLSVRFDRSKTDHWSLPTLKLGGGGQANFGNVKITKAKKADEQ